MAWIPVWPWLDPCMALAGSLYGPGSHGLGPGNTNRLGGYYPSPATPGTPPPTTPLLHALVLHATGSAQRLAHSVKTVDSGSPIYRQSINRHVPSVD